MDPETTSEGQLALYPDLTEEQAKVAAKRKYNRRIAARIRRRDKQAAVVLQEQVVCLHKRTDELSRSNKVLKTQIEELEMQCCELRASRSAEEQPPPRSVSSCFASSSIFLTITTSTFL